MRDLADQLLLKASTTFGFPGMFVEKFMAALHSELFLRGYQKDNTLPMLSLCRDELSSSLADKFQQDWGQPFNLSGLGGQILCGSSAIAAGMSHVPSHGAEGGRVLVLAGGHIGLDTILYVKEPYYVSQNTSHVSACLTIQNFGVVKRDGILQCTDACGALQGVKKILRAQQFPSSKDFEMHQLYKNIAGDLSRNSALETIQIANQMAIHQQLDDLSNKCPWEHITLVAAIHVHTPKGLRDIIVPTLMTCQSQEGLTDILPVFTKSAKKNLEYLQSEP